MGVFLSFEFMTLCGKGGHSRQVAAFYEIETPRPRVEGGHLRSVAATRQSGHLRPLAATREKRPLAATLQVAASGCFL